MQYSNYLLCYVFIRHYCKMKMSISILCTIEEGIEANANANRLRKLKNYQNVDVSNQLTDSGRLCWG